MYSGITSGRVLDGELLYTKILEVNFSFAFAYRLLHKDFSSIDGALHGTHSFFSFLSNMKQIISNHNKTILNKDDNTESN